MNTIKEGDIFYRTIEITSQIMETFAVISGDYNPIHVDEVFAKNMGFKGRVVYGNILGLLVSALVGEGLPMKEVMIISEQLNFKSIIYIGDIIRLSATVSTISEATGVIELKLNFLNNSEDKVANGKLQIKLI
ncbi:MAG: MaoC family dehydratase N-terminal domain-containing protein [Nitrospirae bacterium]|nr:MaoC family dehydratase N-terminal domain-containing protein [Nitrospirota bacterium]